MITEEAFLRGSKRICIHAVTNCDHPNFAPDLSHIVLLFSGISSIDGGNKLHIEDLLKVSR